ncbi:MAG TPA: type II secretion system protein E [Chloroflexi bacterium]|nr:type II secretion system protein E [Chloroflexota bacterium]
MNFAQNGRSAPRADPSRSGGNGRPDGGGPYAAIRDRVQRRLLAELNPTVDTNNVAEVRRTLERIFAETLAEDELLLSRTDRADLFEQIVAQVLGYGAIEPLLRDDTITEIMVNGPNQVYVERNGILEETDLYFRDADEVLRIIGRIVAPLGRRIDESSPMVDARLPDGSRVNAIIPPLSLVGPVLSIRKFPKTALTADDLIRLGAITKEMVDFLRACVLARLNIVVSGGTSTGKTTFLNVLSSFLPARERIITIEDAAELQLRQRHVIPLEARPPNVEGRGAIPIRQLVINALRMRPDRIIVGEVRGGEALDMLQAMNTGHDGSMTTAHSNSPRDTLHRVETMVLMAGMDLPLRAIREQIAAAFDLIVHLDRLADGTRRVTRITEVQGMEGDVIVMQDIFRFVQVGVQDGRVQGHFTPMGIRPKFMEKIEAAGLFVSPSIFAPLHRSGGR